MSVNWSGRTSRLTQPLSTTTVPMGLQTLAMRVMRLASHALARRGYGIRAAGSSSTGSTAPFDGPLYPDIAVLRQPGRDVVHSEWILWWIRNGFMALVMDAMVYYWWML